MRRLKVWFAAAVPAGSYGGVGRSIAELANGLRAAGHIVVVHQLPRSGLGRSFVGFSMMLGLKLLLSLRKPDGVIARSTDGAMCAVVARILRLRTRIILHNHGWEEKVFDVERRLPRDMVRHPTTWKAHVVRFPLLRLTLRLSHGCVSGTVGEVRWIADRYPQHAAKLAYVPNGVNVPDGAVAARDWSRASFLVVGGHTWKKDVVYAMNLLRRIRAQRPAARAFWVGSGRDGERLVQALGLPPESVTVVEEVPFDRMTEWYSRCGFLLSTSRFEGGHSMAILEAMAHGMVVFASSIDSTREIVLDGVSGFLITGCDAGGDANTVLAAMADSARLDAVSSRARRAAQRNRWERQVRRLERLLGRVCSERGRQSA